MQTEIENQGRRRFLVVVGAGSGYLLMAGSGILSLLLGGCSVITDIENWVPIALTSLSSIQALLGVLATPLIVAIFTQIKAALSDLLAAAQEYDKAPDASKGTALGKMQTALTAITDNFQNMLAQLPGVGAIISLVIGLVQIILTTIAGFVTKLPAAPAGAVNPTMRASIKAHNQTVTIPPIYRNKKKFRGDWNSMCALAGHPESQI